MMSMQFSLILTNKSHIIIILLYGGLKFEGAEGGAVSSLKYLPGRVPPCSTNLLNYKSTVPVSGHAAGDGCQQCLRQNPATRCIY